MLRRRRNLVLAQPPTATENNGKIFRALFRAVVTIALLFTFGVLGISIWQVQQKRQDLDTHFVPITEYNRLVAANNKLTGAVSNLQDSLLLQQKAFDVFRSEWSSLTNVYLKMGEIENLARLARQQAVDLHSQQEGIQASLSNMSVKLDGFQRALLKLSQGFQQLQSSQGSATLVQPEPIPAE